MRIIDTFRFWKEILLFVLIIAFVGLIISYNEAMGEVSMKDVQISELNDKVSKIQNELQKQNELYRLSEDLREEMQGIIEELEWEKEDINKRLEEATSTNSQLISDTSSQIGKMKNNQEWMVKVINNGTKLTEAIDKYVRTYNSWWSDDMMTESAWEKVENTARCYADSVNDLKFGMLVSDCY